MSLKFHQFHQINEKKQKMQATAFKSIGMWLIMWFWRLGCSCAMLEHLTISNFADKLWDYLTFTSYIGWAYLIILTLFTQIHYTEVTSSSFFLKMFILQSQINFPHFLNFKALRVIECAIFVNY